jgi:hypothetical protein
LCRKDRDRKKEGRKEDKSHIQRERNTEIWKGGTTTQQAKCGHRKVSNYRQILNVKLIPAPN